ncbi:hypothetical protein ACFPES_05230 [Paenibacillus sp. GCM10023248]|uniref:hypothetical protein n=1 Tax=unclassified Paenibacillus TaxID=185978 RepID=UPI0023799E14|nr:hypothetical protein [Paenibacillus sp. MAHUQ-63]MDD9266432.1 hypothetical protein [Paenibacillus sp. MAHUQ-63]
MFLLAELELVDGVGASAAVGEGAEGEWGGGVPAVGERATGERGTGVLAGHRLVSTPDERG